MPDSCFLELSYKEKKLDPELALEVQGVGDGATLTLLKTKGALKVESTKCINIEEPMALST